jgi:TRAP-type transport system periplasmic protein
VAGSLAQFYPDSLVYGLPLIFRSLEEVDYVRERMDPLIMKRFEENGVVAFGLAEGGFAYVMSNSPVQTTRDVNQQKVWIPDSDNFLLRSVEVFDIKPIPLSIADVRAGLQTGLIDTVAVSPVGAVTLQWHTQVKYLMDLPLLYIYAVFAVDKKAFSRISSEDQEIVREVMGRIFREVDRRNREDNGKALEALQNQGVTFIRPSPEAVDEWTKKAGEVPRRLIDSGELSQKMYDVLMGHLSDFRSKSAGADGKKP